MLTYMIVVNDNGEMKSINQEEFEDDSINIPKAMQMRINRILDERSAKELASTSELDHD